MKIGVLMGGISFEREISLLSGKEIVKNLNKDKYEVIPVIINSKKEVINKVQDLDFAFLAFHGEFGEDGTIQSILESMGIPYSGSNPLTSALCMNKKQCKRILKAEGIPMAKGINLYKHEGVNLKEIEKLKYPMIVKPNSGGSSIGISLVYSREELRNAILEGFKYGDEIIIEEYINGSEYTVPLLNGETLPILSIVHKGTFFDYESKYNDKDTIEEVAILPEYLQNEINEISKKCYSLFDCKAYARVDIMVSNNKPYVLELNTLPGMTKNSLFPKSARASNMEYSTLLDKIIEFSLI
ncbi:D-alanine--D-alanine ligase [uncultured Clostridium sp.]|uniref:D-alanine--D-alanine ligase n=1 Tax=uncultured Clostridium sp. TaxID=59620 RepID=UPI003217FAD2